MTIVKLQLIVLIMTKDASNFENRNFYKHRSFECLVVRHWRFWRVVCKKKMLPYLSRPVRYFICVLGKKEHFLFTFSTLFVLLYNYNGRLYTALYTNIHTCHVQRKYKIIYNIKQMNITKTHSIIIVMIPSENSRCLRILLFSWWSHIFLSSKKASPCGEVQWEFKLVRFISYITCEDRFLSGKTESHVYFLISICHCQGHTFLIWKNAIWLFVMLHDS